MRDQNPTQLMITTGGEVGVVVYVMTRFPVLSETFILREIDQMAREGISVLPVSLRPVKLGDSADELMRIWASRTMYFSKSQYAMSGPVTTVALARVAKLRSVVTTVGLRRANTVHRTVQSFAAVAQGVALAARLRGRPVTWIHSHFAGAATTAAWALSVMADTPFSFTPHAADLHVGSFVDGLLLDKIGAAAFVVAISEYNRRYLSEVSGVAPDDKKFPLVRYGLPESYFAAEGPLQERSSVPHILSVGRLVEKKGHSYLLEALAILCERGRQFHCTIVGDGELRAQLERDIDRLALSDQVTMKGAVGQRDVVSLLDEADVFCLPAVVATDGDRDGLPNVLIEALAKRVAVVTTDVTGIPELVQDGVTGLVVGQRDAQALADALDRLLQDCALRSGLAARGYGHAQASHNLHNEVSRLAARMSPMLI